MECPECGKNFYGMQMMIQNVSVIFAASLICDFCPSDQSFAYSFLQIPSHDGHPYCSAIHFPLSGRVRDFHPLERAHGAQTKKRRYISTFFLILMNIRNDTTPALDLSSGAKRCQYLKVLKYSKISFYGTHAIITDTKIPVIPIINETEFNIRFLVLS